MVEEEHTSHEHEVISPTLGSTAAARTEALGSETLFNKISRRGKKFLERSGRGKLNAKELKEGSVAPMDTDAEVCFVLCHQQQQVKVCKHCDVCVSIKTQSRRGEW